MAFEPDVLPKVPVANLLGSARAANALAHKAKERGEHQKAARLFREKTGYICQAMLAGEVKLSWHKERHAILVYTGDGNKAGVHVTISAMEKYIRSNGFDPIEIGRLRCRVERVKTKIGRRKKKCRGK